jgi:hypothetical protein
MRRPWPALGCYAEAEEEEEEEEVEEINTECEIIYVPKVLTLNRQIKIWILVEGKHDGKFTDIIVLTYHITKLCGRRQ